jgi:hypothetical protein
MTDYLKKKTIRHEQAARLNVAALNVENCARCTGSHNNLPIIAFRIPMKKSSYTDWDYYMVCPTTTEPIVLNLEIVFMEDGWEETIMVPCCVCRDDDTEELADECGCKCHEDEA